MFIYPDCKVMISGITSRAGCKGCCFGITVTFEGCVTKLKHRFVLALLNQHFQSIWIGLKSINQINQPINHCAFYIGGAVCTKLRTLYANSSKLVTFAFVSNVIRKTCRVVPMGYRHTAGLAVQLWPPALTPGAGILKQFLEVVMNCARINIDTGISSLSNYTQLHESLPRRRQSGEEKRGES